MDSYFKTLFETLVESLKRGLGGPFAAGVVHQEELIAVGTNSVLSSFDVSRHAEVNAVAAAGAKRRLYHMPDSILLTTHFPCLMCYHAIKWARIPTVYYVFDYDETESLFGFSGDSSFLEDLQMSKERVAEDPSLKVIRYRTPMIESVYYGELIRRWNEEFKEHCSDYDIA
jgi:guanine deaminase